MIGATFEQRLHWTRANMPTVAKALSLLPSSLRGVKLACSMHLEIKMGPLIEGLISRGAEIFLTTCNPETVQDEAMDYFKTLGAHTYAWRHISSSEHEKSLQAALEWGPTHLCEMGADLTSTAIQKGLDTSRIKAALEATGSGISRLENLSPSYPIFNWDDVPIKEGLHNRYMVGLMTWNAFLTRTGLTLHGKRVAVIGFGLVGCGVAEAARAFGGSVMVVEKDPSRSLEAQYAGWDLKPMEYAIQSADVIVTATGCKNVIQAEHFAQMRDSTFLVNVGHAAHEIDTAALLSFSHREVLPLVQAVQVASRVLYLFAHGSMANLVAGSGDSLNAFDTTLGIMIGGIHHIIHEGADEKVGLHLLPRQAWERFICL